MYAQTRFMNCYVTALAFVKRVYKFIALHRKLRSTFNWNMSGALVLLITLLLSERGIAQKKAPPPSPIVFRGSSIAYTPDSLGNRVPDFSYAGYKAGNEIIPYVDTKIIVPVKGGDATNRIQRAIDYVAELPLDKNGFRGTIQLQKGTYELAGRLKIKASGIVLRGAGFSQGGTILIATGLDRETLLTIGGKNDRTIQREQKITDVYVPVNAVRFHIADATEIKAGDNVIIRRPCTQAWIDQTGTKTFGGENRH